MRKALVTFAAGIAILGLAAAPAFAGPNCGAKADKTSASAVTAKKACSADKAKLTSDKAACDAKGATTAMAANATTGKEVCKVAHAAGCEMTAEECKALCSYDGKMTVVNMNVSGMTCGGCESSIKSTLANVPGVVNVLKVCHKSGTAMVAVDPSKLEDNTSLTTAVSNKGYGAEIIPAVATSSTAGEKKACTAAEKAACADKKKAEGTSVSAQGSH